ncbi:MAG: SpoVR family protein [Gammaproteobacteria bacterium]
MSVDLDIDELRRWDERIRAKVDDFGLDCYPQEFEVCDHLQMLGFMAYSGMPAHYPHWSYGKSYEKLKTTYDHGVSGLPYEMVINSNPCIAYLMRDNSLTLTVLTIAHVYGHNDFFKNNFTFRHTRADHTIASFKLHAERVREYVEDPSIGRAAVEALLDAAHALSLQLNPNRAIRRRSRDEQLRALEAATQPPPDPFHAIHKTEKPEAPDFDKVPLEPEGDILLFIRDHNPRLAEWQKDLLTIVHEEAEYFLPQIETKIMNEGWASFWHRTIMNSLRLPQEMHMEFLVHHNQVVRPIPGELNPYHIGLKVWDDIWRRSSGGDTPDSGIEPGSEALQQLFQVREVDRDASFLRRFLTRELMEEMDLFQYETAGQEQVVTHVANEEGWETIKRTLIANVGMGAVPVIKVEDADFGGNRTLLLRHYHDGRDLKLDYTEKTLEHLHTLWNGPVALESSVNGRGVLLSYDDEGFDSREWDAEVASVTKIQEGP